MILVLLQLMTDFVFDSMHNLYLVHTQRSCTKDRGPQAPSGVLGRKLIQSLHSGSEMWKVTSLRTISGCRPGPGRKDSRAKTA
jgi:hypothetical protein